MDIVDSLVELTDRWEISANLVAIPAQLFLGALSEFANALGLLAVTKLWVATEDRNPDTAISEVVVHAIGKWGIAESKGAKKPGLRVQCVYANVAKSIYCLDPFLVPAVDEGGATRVAFLSQVRAHGAEAKSVRAIAYREPLTGALISRDPGSALAKISKKLGRSILTPARIEKLSLDEAARLPAPARNTTHTKKRECIGEFEVTGELGKGGMSKVLLAWQPSVGRNVALKVLPPDLCREPLLVARFKSEVIALGMTNHPNVVTPFVTGSDHDEAGQIRHFYAMEYIRGRNLAQILRSLHDFHDRLGKSLGSSTIAALLPSPLSVDEDGENWDSRDASAAKPRALRADHSYYLEVARIISQAARGLHALHRSGVYHRDIKPGNIMVSGQDGRAVVMDLGLARLWNADLSLGTRSLMVLGTLRYMPPEQLGQGAHEVRERADIYALGATLFELATIRPFCVAKSFRSLTNKVMFDEQVDPRAMNPAIPESLANIISAATAKLPEERYATAAELADQLDSFVRGEAVPRRKVATILPAGMMAEVTAEEYRTIAEAIAGAKDEDAAYLARRKYVGQRFAAKLTRAVDMRIKALRESKQLRFPLRSVASARDTTSAERAFRRAKNPDDSRLLTIANEFAKDFLAGSENLTNTIGARLRRVHAGSFEMGDEEFRDNPLHHVEITRDFYLGVFAITNQEWRHFKAGHDSGEIQGHSLDGDDQPVVAVGWVEADSFCRWLSEREGRRYRLPTEAEWEYVARAGRRNSDSRFPWSNGPKGNPSRAEWPPSGRAGNYADLAAFRELRRGKPQGYDYDDGFPVTSPVGSFDPNPWGFFDMGGNTWDWCLDWYDPFACAESTRDAKGPNDYTIGMYKVARGGSFKNNDRKGLMTASRSHFDHSSRLDNCGVRLVLET